MQICFSSKRGAASFRNQFSFNFLVTCCWHFVSDSMYKTKEVFSVWGEYFGPHWVLISKPSRTLNEQGPEPESYRITQRMRPNRCLTFCEWEQISAAMFQALVRVSVRSSVNRDLSLMSTYLWSCYVVQTLLRLSSCQKNMKWSATELYSRIEQDWVQNQKDILTCSYFPPQILLCWEREDGSDSLDESHFSH